VCAREDAAAEVTLAKGGLVTVAFFALTIAWKNFIRLSPGEPAQTPLSHPFLNVFRFILTAEGDGRRIGFEHVQIRSVLQKENGMYIEICYVTYLAISLAVTIWVAQTLKRNGRAFLVDAFHDNRELADSVNHLLVVGFYLINVGYVTLALRTTAQVADARAAIELVCDKVGLVLIVLGGMHFMNLYVFNRLRRRGQAELRPPIGPDGRLSFPSEA
jgi:hypothetical protein